MVILCFFSSVVRFPFGFEDSLVGCNVHLNWFALASYFLLLCHYCNWSNRIPRWHYLQFELERLSCWATKTYDLDHNPFSRTCTFHWIKFDLLHIGSIWKSKHFNRFYLSDIFRQFNEIFCLFNSCSRLLVPTISFSENSYHVEFKLFLKYQHLKL